MIKKAVIPAAGFGTRFLPATKAQPKEMLPVVDTPVVEYVVAEAIRSGIEDIVIVIGRGKRAIEEHFTRNIELEIALEEQGKTRELQLIEPFGREADIHFVWQHEQRGLGHAIQCAQKHIGNEPFAVLLGDTILESLTDTPVLKQLIEVHDKYDGAVIALEEVSLDRISRYGIIKGTEVSQGVYRVEDLVEKPKPEEAPSNLAIASRYILPARIFNVLGSTELEENREVQLTDAIKSMLGATQVHGRKIDGMRHDIGNKLEFIKANVHFGLKREDIGQELRRWLEGI